jgi:hypothetical protein
MQYALLIYENDAEAYPEGEAGQACRDIVAAHGSFSAELAQAGAMRGGAGLKPVQTATTVRVSPAGRTLHDGPYAETRELPDKIELKASQMIFQVKKPGDWKKGWTLSKKQLHEYLLNILPEHGEDVMREIVRRHEPKLTATDYAFELKPME